MNKVGLCGNYVQCVVVVMILVGDFKCCYWFGGVEQLEVWKDQYSDVVGYGRKSGRLVIVVNMIECDFVKC